MKVAVIALIESNNYDSDYNNVYFEKHITEWTELTKEEYGELILAVDYMNRNSYVSNIIHKIILFPQKEKDAETKTQKEFILEKVLDYKEYLQQQRLKEQKEQEEKERIKLEKRLKRELKTKEQKMKLLEELKKELGDA